MLITEALKIWAIWQESYSLKLGYPAKVSAVATGGISCWDDLADSVDNWISGEVDASVSDLSMEHPAQGAAIHHEYLHAVWRFPRGDYREVLQHAHEWLTADLLRRGVQIDVDR